MKLIDCSSIYYNEEETFLAWGGEYFVL